jgi:hypothetical protein
MISTTSPYSLEITPRYELLQNQWIIVAPAFFWILREIGFIVDFFAPFVVSAVSLWLNLAI